MNPNTQQKPTTGKTTQPLAPVPPPAPKTIQHWVFWSSLACIGASLIIYAMRFSPLEPALTQEYIISLITIIAEGSVFAAALIGGIILASILCIVAAITPISVLIALANCFAKMEHWPFRLGSNISVAFIIHSLLGALNFSDATKMVISAIVFITMIALTESIVSAAKKRAP